MPDLHFTENVKAADAAKPHEVHQAPYIPETQEVALTQVQESPVSLWGSASPTEVIAKAAEVATALAAVVDKKGLFTMIQGRKHVRVEGWTLLGSILGVFPVCVWTRRVDLSENEQGWEARVEAVRDGKVVGAAEASCLRSEKSWKDRDDYALRSMAQTRATSKALRMPLGFVVSLAGYEPCPAEEMDGVDLRPALEASIEAVKAKKAGAVRVEIREGEPQPGDLTARPWKEVLAKNPPRHTIPNPAISPEVATMLDKAKANREREQAKLDERGPVDRAKLRKAGFDIAEAEDKPQTCARCGGDLKRYEKNGVAYMQCVGGRQEWLDLIRSGKTAQEASALTKGHTYKKLRD